MTSVGGRFFHTHRGEVFSKKSKSHHLLFESFVRDSRAATTLHLDLGLVCGSEIRCEGSCGKQDKSSGESQSVRCHQGALASGRRPSTTVHDCGVFILDAGFWRRELEESRVTNETRVVGVALGSGKRKYLCCRASLAWSSSGVSDNTAHCLRKKCTSIGRPLDVR